MLREHVRKGSKAAIIEISLKGGVKHDKTSLNALSTHEQCWLYTDVYSFYVVTGHVFRRCGHNSFISEQDEFDQRTGMIGTNTAADDKEVLVILQNRFLNMHRSLKESPHDFVY